MMRSNYNGSFHQQLRSVMLVVLATALGMSVPTAYAQPAAFVTSESDSGQGSLREALTSGATLIRIVQSVQNINIQSTLVYDSTNALTIQGFGQTIKAGGDYTLLQINQGADLSVSKVSFEGIGGFSVDTQGTGKGIFIDVPDDRTGTVNLDLRDVSVSDVAFHGIHVSDCTLADECGNGGGGGGDGSPASIHANLKRVTVMNVGNGKFDGDGIRIDERGDGDINFQVTDSTILLAGADGIELDEGDAGNVDALMERTVLQENGGYCLGVDIANPVDPACIDDGELDLDDGFDIDEAGEGSLHAVIRSSIAIGNYDEGFDFDEEGPGDIVATFTLITAENNGDEGIKCSEEDEGNVDIKVKQSSVKNNGDDGMQLESEDAGRIDVVVVNSQAFGNEKKDLKVEQDDAVDLGSLKITASSSIESVDPKNVELL